jgi:uncharacterized protein YprB with RNaseH-like and TPR domain
MMSRLVELRERLARMGYFKTVPATVAAPNAAERPPAPPIDSAARLGAPDVHEVVEGRHRESPYGRCFVGETRYPLDYAHAGVALSDLLDAAGDALALLGADPRLAFVDPERAVLVDVETTGLAGGTGTYVFLVGLGYFAAGGFCIDQFFLRDPSEERAMLGTLAETLARCDAIVTFNGKCFDWPLIETRHVYHRLALRPSAPLHLDLLFPARRLFKRRLGACNLTALEVGALGQAERQDDVPGWLIPTIYFDYLRCRDGRPLAQVFHHNRLDILTMLALVVHMARRVTDPFGAAPDHPIDFYSLGRFYEHHGRFERAVQCYERALATTAPGLDRAEVLHQLSSAYKRLDDHERAVGIWAEMVAAGASSIYPYVELAKHLEHRAREHERAAELTRQALAHHDALRPTLGTRRWREERAELVKRLARLERKLAAQRGERRPAAVV